MISSKRLGLFNPVNPATGNRKTSHFLIGDVSHLSPMNATTGLTVDIPTDLNDALADYLAKHPDWDLGRVLAAALSLFLLQNGDRDRRVSRVYLEALFHQPTAPETEEAQATT